MDQKKSNIPVMGKTVKDESPLTQRVIGVKVHGIGNYVYLCDDTVRGGGNLIIDVLRRTLLDIEKKGKLPYINPVLYLQIDNCGENKNKTLFAFLTDLVRKQVFHKIKASFLMVGHTHEDIDQGFATISDHLRQLHVICPDRESLIREIKNAFLKAEDKPTIVSLAATDIFDYTAFYKKIIDKNISYHQMPHQFRIKCFKTSSSNPDRTDVVLVHYKNWSESKFWHPRYDVPDEPENIKVAKGQWTRGQRAEQIRAKVSASSSQTKDIAAADVDENEGYETEGDKLDLRAAGTEHSGYSCKLQGILWLSANTSFESFPLVRFSEEQLATNRAKVQKIYDDIMTKFASKYHEIFSETVLSNWTTWLETETWRWSPESKRCTHAELVIPLPYSVRVVVLDETNVANLVVDSAKPDMDDGVGYVTYDSGTYGSLTKDQQREALANRDAIMLPDDTDSSECVDTILENMACIYKFTYPHLQSGKTIEQIAVGIVVKVQNASTENALVDIRFCPAKGAKPQTAHRPDTLYQDISPTMCFNVKYTTTRKVAGSKLKVPDIETNQPHSVL